MKITDIDAYINGLGAKWQRERAESQMTLGKLISALEAMPKGACIANLKNAHSYRGYYSDLAFEQGEGQRPAAELLAECKAAMGKVCEGYKGGSYVMGALTPVWVASYGSSGLKMMAIHVGGEIETEDDGTDE